MLQHVDHRQKNWPEWLAIAKFAVNIKTHSATKVSLFIANYDKELKMRADIKRKRKVENAIEFVEKIKKIQKEAEAALIK